MTELMARYDIVEVRTVTRKIVFIVDKNDGAMSVTNNAEAVVEAINRLFPNCRIFYRDSEGQWDELQHASGMFTGFSAGTDGHEPPAVA